MKNNILLAAVLFFGMAASAQTTPATPTQPVTDTASATVALVDTSIGKAYVSHPERLQGLTTETLTMADIFPALGSYKGSGSSAEEVNITLDETNKGTVWVEGLPQGKCKAIMKKAPATYKIPAQKLENGKSVAEGTLYLNPETNELHIILGQSFNDQDPTSFLTVASKKTKTWQYTGLKTVAEPTIASPASQQ